MFTHFYGDPHFGHTNILEYARRPFTSIEAMNESLITTYNRMVGQDDLVLWLGDCWFHGQANLLQRMNGRKALVTGNHDDHPAKMVEAGFEFAVRELFFRVGNLRFQAIHNPARIQSPPGVRQPGKFEWKPPIKGCVAIHGHTHSGVRQRGPYINVGVDAWDYGPAPLAEVLALVKERHEVP